MSAVAERSPPRGASGLLIAAVCFLAWGLYPFYFKALGQVHPIEVVAHRIVWSAAVLAALLPFLGGARELVTVLRTPRLLLPLVLTTALISLNWVVYVAAVQQGQVLDASLGYFLGPLVSVALGVLVLKERLSPVQAAAVLLAGAAVLNLIWQLRVVPVVALVLGVSFSLYGLIRKRLPVSPAVGLLTECLLALPLALAALLWLDRSVGVSFLHGSRTTDLLLLFAGIATAGPLLLFNLGAKRLNYATLGVMQYIAPTMLFLESVLVFGEPMNPWRLVTFVLIWTALALYTGDAIVRMREARHG